MNENYPKGSRVRNIGSGQSTINPVAVEITPIGESLQALDQAIGENQHLIDALERRVGSVLRQISPACNKEEIERTPFGSSETAMRISAASQRLVSQSRMFSALLDRIEL